MRIAVCEDNRADLDELCGYIKSFCADQAFACDLHLYDNGEALLADAAVAEPFHLAFIDIYLPGCSGLETARRLRRLCPRCTLILVTISTQHALEGYAVAAISYIVKPLTAAKMAQAFALARREFEENGRVIQVPQGSEVIPLSLPLIRYVEVYNKCASFHMQRGEVLARLPLDEIERQLDGGPFLRCHRSYIVNLNYVADVEEQDFVLDGGERVPIRRKGRRELKLEATRFFAMHVKGAMRR